MYTYVYPLKLSSIVKTGFDNFTEKWPLVHAFS